MSQQTGKRNFFKSCLEAVLFGGIFLVLGAGLSFWGWNILQSARASSSWPTSNGVVTSSEVTRSTDAEGGDSYSPEVRYEYEVGDVTYQNNTIQFGENAYDSLRKAESIAAGYPAGSHVTVYYEPADPAQSVLEPGVSAGSFIVLALGVLFGLIGLAAAVGTVIFKRY